MRSADECCFTCITLSAITACIPDPSCSAWPEQPSLLAVQAMLVIPLRHPARLVGAGRLPAGDPVGLFAFL